MQLISVVCVSACACAFFACMRVCFKAGNCIRNRRLFNDGKDTCLQSDTSHEQAECE